LVAAGQSICPEPGGIGRISGETLSGIIGALLAGSPRSNVGLLDTRPKPHQMINRGVEQKGDMSRYDEQYQVEENLFGEPYPEFVSFVQAMDLRGNALDLGCGQGRDSLMLAAEGFRVIAVDESKTGVSQMVETARAQDLNVTGMVGDFYQFEFPEDYDLIVLDSILHFGRDSAKELDLLDRVFAHTKKGGHVFVFIHKSQAKEKCLKQYVSALVDDWRVVEDRHIDYTYEETQTGFRSESQFNMLVVRKRMRGSEEA
jgi:SAM-dependent methyltransferase